jgi:hypothetical protein
MEYEPYSFIDSIWLFFTTAAELRIWGAKPKIFAS